MNYDLHKPCANCPFLKEGGVRLTAGRVREIANPRSGEFACHKTTVPDGEGDRRATDDSQHCAGSLIFHEKCGTSTQMMRICERLGFYDPRKLRGQDLVFDDLDQMLDAAEDARRPAKRPSSRRSTSNGNTSGNSYDRRARRAWVWKKFSRWGHIACKWCRRRLRKAEFQVDRWPACGHAGGRYVRGNIVPACHRCNGGRCAKTCLKAKRG